MLPDFQEEDMVGPSPLSAHHVANELRRRRAAKPPTLDDPALGNPLSFHLDKLGEKSGR